MSQFTPDMKEGVLTRVRETTAHPSMYRVLLHNDDYTTKEFVVQILLAVFNKSMEEATRIMWQAHKTGVGMCGVYTYEVAETKVNLVQTTARENGFPLQTTIEKE